ncbi:MAG: hypothetical protein PHW76_07800 [Alphaproteobacteria bacterium]|nr:hypothetical protein [Alphaproteobacteria bacterium]
MRMPDVGFEFKEPRPSSIRPGDFPQTPITAKTDVRSLAKYVVEKELGIFNPSEEERIYVEERIAGQIGIDDYLGRTVKPENYSSAAIDALRAFRVEKGVKRPG